MQLKHSFTVPTDLEQAWEVLLDIERIAPCMPGAAVETVDGDDFTGTVKVRLGPIGLTYKGKASFVEKDASRHRAVIDAQGKDARGNGTAKARIIATLTARGSDGTAVEVVTDLNITGKPAQFGRGVMIDVGNKLIGQFADCLAGKLSAPESAEVAGGAEPGGAELAGADLGAADAATVERLAHADLEGAEQLGTADPDTAELGAAELGGADLGAADAATVERLAHADLEGAEQLGTADPDTAELGVSAPDADRAAVASGEVDFGAGSPAADQAAGSGLTEPGAVEAGLAELGTAPSVSPESSIAGPGLAAPAAGTPAADEAVVALAGLAPQESAVEPSTAAAAAPPAQRLADAGAASVGDSSPAVGRQTGAQQTMTEPVVADPWAAHAPAQRPAVADVEPIDLLDSAGPALAKRLAPAVAGALLVVMVVLRRKRSGWNRLRR
jgi:carbon monoxide dehydrogenase subunit G